MIKKKIYIYINRDRISFHRKGWCEIWENICSNKESESLEIFINWTYSVFFFALRHHAEEMMETAPETKVKSSSVFFLTISIFFPCCFVSSPETAFYLNKLILIMKNEIVDLLKETPDDERHKFSSEGINTFLWKNTHKTHLQLLNLS